MSHPIPPPIRHAIAKLRRLSAIALWFATLFGRLLPGAARRAEQAEAWRFIEATMTQFADLLERLAAGEIEPVRPRRATQRHHSRQSSATPRTYARAIRQRSAPTPSRVPPRPQFPPRDQLMAPPRTRKLPAKPKKSKMRLLQSSGTRVYFVTISE